MILREVSIGWPSFGCTTRARGRSGEHDVRHLQAGPRGGRGMRTAPVDWPLRRGADQDVP